MLFFGIDPIASSQAFSVLLKQHSPFCVVRNRSENLSVAYHLPAKSCRYQKFHARPFNSKISLTISSLIF